jgi:Tol biopolymer transport system component
VNDDARQRDLFVLSVDGSRETAVDTRPGYDTTLGWSPDGRSLLFTSDRSDATAVWALRMANDRPEGSPKLVYADLGTFYGSLGMTTTGTLAFIRKTGAVNVFSVAVDFATGTALGAPEPVTHSYLWDHGQQSWSPDGKFIAYPTLGQTTKAFVVQNLASGQIRDITPKITNFSFPRWSSDRFIVFQGSDLKGRQGIYRLDVETAEVSPVATGDGYLSWASSTRDGRFVVFGRNITGQPIKLVVKDVATGVERDLAQGSSATVSPDGRLVAYRKTEGNSAGIYVVPIAGGEPKELMRATRPSSLWAFMDWLPDSGRLLLARQENGRSTLLVVPVDGGPSVELKVPAPTGGPLRVHPDGRRLSYLSGDSAVEVWTLENFLPEATSARR